MARLGPVMQKVEEEEGQTFWTVVRDYAEMGCSKSETARLLGYANERAFLKLLRNNPDRVFNWPANGQSAMFKYICEQRGRRGSKEHQNCCYAGKMASEKLSKRYWVDGIYDTARNHYDRINPDVSFKTVVWRLRKWEPELAFKLARIPNDVSGRNGGIACNMKKAMKSA